MWWRGSIACSTSPSTSGARRRRGGGRGACRRSPLLGSGPFGRRARHLLGALLGHDDVALLFGGGFVVDGLQGVRPRLSGSLARTGGIELLTVAKRIRGRRI